MTVQETIHEMAVRARAASAGLAKMTTEEKNAALLAVADALEGARGAICGANAADVSRAKETGIVRFERLGRDRKQVSVYPVETAAEAQ